MLSAVLGAVLEKPSDKAVEETVEKTVDMLQVAAVVVVGAIIGLITAFVVQAVIMLMIRRHPMVRPVARAMRRAVKVLVVLVGAWIAYNFGAPGGASTTKWYSVVNHIFFILTILAVTWVIASFVKGIEIAVVERVKESGEGRARRVHTQLQIMHRVLIVIIWALGIAVVLLTFPAARAAGASLFASAGIVSVVAGLAAQSTLGNVFAGLQLAFSDSIRVGDVVVVNKEYSVVEEITLTYVVLRIWDGRRIIMPSSKMTTEPFENWTRMEPAMMGDVRLEVDWNVPIEAMRMEMKRLLAKTPLWDGRTGVLRVLDVGAGVITVSILISAESSSVLSDLKYYMREEMVEWVQRYAPQAIPRTRRYFGDEPEFDVEAERSEEYVREAVAAEAPPESILPEGDGLTAAGRRGVARDPEPTPATRIMTVDELHQYAETVRTPVAQRGLDAGESVKKTDPSPTHESSFFSRPEEEALKEAFSGPAPEVYEQRRRNAEAQAQDARKKDAAPPAAPAEGDTAPVDPEASEKNPPSPTHEAATVNEKGNRNDPQN